MGITGIVDEGLAQYYLASNAWKLQPAINHYFSELSSDAFGSNASRPVTHRNKRQKRTYINSQSSTPIKLDKKDIHPEPIQTGLVIHVENVSIELSKVDTSDVLEDVTSSHMDLKNTPEPIMMSDKMKEKTSAGHIIKIAESVVEPNLDMGSDTIETVIRNICRDLTEDAKHQGSLGKKSKKRKKKKCHTITGDPQDDMSNSLVKKRHEWASQTPTDPSEVRIKNSCGKKDIQENVEPELIKSSGKSSKKGLEERKKRNERNGAHAKSQQVISSPGNTRYNKPNETVTGYTNSGPNCTIVAKSQKAPNDAIISFGSTESTQFSQNFLAAENWNMSSENVLSQKIRRGDVIQNFFAPIDVRTYDSRPCFGPVGRSNITDQQIIDASDMSCDDSDSHESETG